MDQRERELVEPLDVIDQDHDGAALAEGKMDRLEEAQWFGRIASMRCRAEEEVVHRPPPPTERKLLRSSAAAAKGTLRSSS